MKRRAISVSLAFFALGLGLSSAANLRLAGSLDPSFGNGGTVTHSSGSTNGIVVQPDGKIVVAGGSFLARYLPNGSPDPSFGDDGYVETHVGSSADAVAMQPNGKVVVAGSSPTTNSNFQSAFALARYNPDGSLDSSFGTGGITDTVIPERASPSFAGADALAILPSGDILAGGTAGFQNDATSLSSSSFALARYKPDGSLDPTFGDNASGIVQTRFDGDPALYGIAVRLDGKIVATGTAFGPGHGLTFERMVIARYTPDGALDPTFGASGKVASPATLNYFGGPSTTVRDGKIAVAGETHKDYPVLGRYTGGGRLDSTFGRHGFRKITRFVGGSTAVLAQEDGKILVGVTLAGSEGPKGGVVARLTANGRLDPTFGTKGIVSLSGAVAATALALQADRKILVGGGSSSNGAVLSRLIGGNNCVVPDLRGETVSKAGARLRHADCRRGRVSKRFSRSLSRGRVISTAPSAGARLPGGAKVDLVVSKGKRP